MAGKLPNFSNAVSKKYFHGQIRNSGNCCWQNLLSSGCKAGGVVVTHRMFIYACNRQVSAFMYGMPICCKNTEKQFMGMGLVLDTPYCNEFSPFRES